MAINRVFYGSQGVSVGGTVVQGAQSVGITTNFGLEQAFQLGQVKLYDNLVNTAEVEVTISKALDGEATIWNLATGGGSIIEQSNDQATIVIGIGDDSNIALSSSTAVQCTGMYVSALTYTIPLEGNMTEEVTFVGNHKAITGSVSAPATSGNMVLRRQNVNLSGSTIPAEVSGKNITSITISATLTRESMYKLGTYDPYHRFVNFPLEVTCEFEVSPTGTDGVAIDTTTVVCTGGSPVPERSIIVKLCEENATDGYTFDLGEKCVLSSINQTGGDTGGGNATTTYTYTTYNDLTISG
jgi:hypothetical protein